MEFEYVTLDELEEEIKSQTEVINSTIENYINSVEIKNIVKKNRDKNKFNMICRILYYMLLTKNNSLVYCDTNTYIIKPYKKQDLNDLKKFIKIFHKMNKEFLFIIIEENDDFSLVSMNKKDNIIEHYFCENQNLSINSRENKILRENNLREIFENKNIETYNFHFPCMISGKLMKYVFNKSIQSMNYTWQIFWIYCRIQGFSINKLKSVFHDDNSHHHLNDQREKFLNSIGLFFEKFFEYYDININYKNIEKFV